jgi:hypothetical protein
MSETFAVDPADDLTAPGLTPHVALARAVMVVNPLSGGVGPGAADEARAILAGYARYVRDEPLIVALDVNPFVPLSTQKTLLKTLQVLDNSLA